MSLWKDLLYVLWFFLPAGLANMAPVFFSKLTFLSPLYQPLDQGKYFRGKRIFGDNKTFLGFLAGIVCAVITTYILQWLFFRYQPWFVSGEYGSISPVIFGILSALGALGGDAIESFFKRQRDIPSGQAWFPFDQIDYITGASLITFIYMPLSWYQYGLAISIFFISHIISTYVGYMLGLKQSPI